MGGEPIIIECEIPCNFLNKLVSLKESHKHEMIYYEIALNITELVMKPLTLCIHIL